MTNSEILDRNKILALEEKISEASKGVRELERIYEKRPSNAVYANICSIRKLHRNLEAELRAERKRQSLADCRVVWRPGWPVMNRYSVEKVGVQE